MDFALKINCDNAAFHPQDEDGDDTDTAAHEVIRILRNTAQRIEQGDENGILRDINGNRVGNYDFTD